MLKARYITFKVKKPRGYRSESLKENILSFLYNVKRI